MSTPRDRTGLARGERVGGLASSGRNDVLPDGTGRGMDLMSPVWNSFDLLPSGRGEDEPENLRPGRRRGEPGRAGGLP